MGPQRHGLVGGEAAPEILHRIEVQKTHTIDGQIHAHDPQRRSEFDMADTGQGSCQSLMLHEPCRQELVDRGAGATPKDGHVANHVDTFLETR
jgi:hypothetical protein